MAPHRCLHIDGIQRKCEADTCTVRLNGIHSLHSDDKFTCTVKDTLEEGAELTGGCVNSQHQTMDQADINIKTQFHQLSFNFTVLSIDMTKEGVQTSLFLQDYDPSCVIRPPLGLNYQVDNPCLRDSHEWKPEWNCTAA